MDKTDQTKRTTFQDKTDHVSGQNGPRSRTKRIRLQDKKDHVSGKKRALFYLGQIGQCKKIDDRRVKILFYERAKCVKTSLKHAFMHSFYSHFAWVFFFCSRLSKKSPTGLMLCYMFVHIRQKLKFLCLGNIINLILIEKCIHRSYGLVCPMHSPFCHETRSVLSSTWSVLSCGGPFCPWSVLSMVRYVPNS